MCVSTLIKRLLKPRARRWSTISN